MPHATVLKPSPGLQAVILCGPGDSLTTFTSTPSDFPKALVPIANRPMLWYPLDWCYRMGISEIFLVTPQESAAPLESALAKNIHLKSLPFPRPLIIAPPTLTHTSPTGDIFRAPELLKAITSDFVVLPCDLICELDGSALLQSWFTLQSGLGEAAANNPTTRRGTTGRRGGLTVWYPAKGVQGISVKDEETDLLATTPLPPPTVPPKSSSLRPHVERVLLSLPSADIDDILDDQAVPIRHSLLRKHGRVKLKQTHKDAHVYFFPHWVLAMMQDQRLETLGEDLIGWWAKAGWQNGLGDKLGLRKILTETTGTRTPDADDHLLKSHIDTEIDLVGMSTTSATSQAKDDLTLAPTYEIPPILAYIQPSPTTASSQPLIHRADTTAHLLNISLRLARLPSITECAAKSILQSPHAHTLKVSSPKQVQPQSRISEADSLVAEGVTIDSRVNIRESVIGTACKIGAGSRLTRCLLMDNVVVGDNVTLTGCTLGRGCVVQGGPTTDKDKTRLTDCEVQNDFTVEWATESKAETFMRFDGLQGDGDQGDSELESDDDQAGLDSDEA